MSKSRKKTNPSSITRLHPLLRQQGMLHRAGYGEILTLGWDSQGLWVGARAALVNYRFEGQGARPDQVLWTPILGLSTDALGQFYTAHHQVDIWSREFVLQGNLAPHRGRVEDVQVSPDGQWIVTLGEDQQVVVCDRQGQEARRWSATAGSRKLYVDWERRKLWSWGEQEVETFDLGTGVRLGSSAPPIEKPPAWAESLLGEPPLAWAMDPQGQWIALANERDLLLAQVDSKELLCEIEDFNEWPLCVAVSPDQRWVVSGGMEGGLSVRRLDSGLLKQRQTAHADAVTSLAFVSATGLASGAADGTMQLWHWPSLEAWQSMDGHDGAVHRLVVCKELLYSAGADGQILIWDWTSGLQVGALPGFDGVVEEFSVVADGQMLLAIYEDGSWVTWDLSQYQT